MDSPCPRKFVNIHYNVKNLDSIRREQTIGKFSDSYKIMFSNVRKRSPPDALGFEFRLWRRSKREKSYKYNNNIFHIRRALHKTREGRPL